MLTLKIAVGIIIGLLFVRLFPARHAPLTKEALDTLVRIEKRVGLIWDEEERYKELKRKVYDSEQLTDDENKTHDELYKRNHSKTLEREIEAENLLKKVAVLVEQSQERQLARFADIIRNKKDEG